ncbi:hypothetical protein ABZ606_01250 [Streptomyces sp. NPDC012461]|uniref:hypothetical protein n=1 Tax=unclassified Streptomyces TaxID=2593676 RepID=UPI0033F69D3E
MRKRRLLGVLTAAAATLGTCLATAPAAEAAPYWQSVSTNSNWTCSPYKSHRLSFNIKLKTCIVRNGNNDAQGVLVVQNSGTKAAVIRGVGDGVQHRSGGFEASYGFSCKESTLNPGFTRGCFGITVSGTSRINLTTTLFMNGHDEANVTQDSWYG